MSAICGPLDFLLLAGVEQVGGDDDHFRLRPAFVKPFSSHCGLGSAHSGRGKMVPLDVMSLEYIRLDESYARDGGLPSKQVEHRHAPAPCPNLNQVSHPRASISETQ
jgi:hypothetical protein